MGDNGDYDYDYYNDGNLSYACTSWAPVLGFTGIVSAVVLSSKSKKVVTAS